METTALERARISLEGLSVGDALGGFLEGSFRPMQMAWVQARKPPDVYPWHYTDDTNMALSVYAILRRHGAIEQDELAQHFAQHYQRERGYGPGARRLLTAIQAGGNWREIAPQMFAGGSYGNGGAMRVAPLGAYFADDMEALIEHARRSAEITHAHPEGIAGTLATALAAALAWNLRDDDKPSRADFLEKLLPFLPESEVKSGIKRAAEIKTTTIDHVVGMIGNGSRISAQDTVPFVLYCAAQWLDDYEEAIWQTISGGGDVDTTAAMVGGIVACFTGTDSIPADWIQHREPLPQWAFQD